MDGNGRWAQKRGLKRTDGHAAGEEALFDVVHGALELGIEWLTVYAFSTENWKRPVDEVRFLMNFNRRILRERREELHDLGVRVRFAGRRDWRGPRRPPAPQGATSQLSPGDKRTTPTLALYSPRRARRVAT